MQLIRTNLENEFIVDMITNNGFIIKQENEFEQLDVDKLINSRSYMDTEYRCECGTFMGRDLIGHTCYKCNHEIKLRALNFEYTGWIDLGEHKVIPPVYFMMLKRVLGGNMLKFILGDYKSDFSVKYNENDTEFEENRKSKKSGRLAANDINSIKNGIAKSKYCYQGLGHKGFMENFEEILTNCAKTGQQQEVDILLKEKHAVFTSKIPVYHTAFRPESQTSETRFYPRINRFFAQMVTNGYNLKNMELDIEKITALNYIQNDWMAATDYLIKNEISKKTGFVRSEITGGTFSFSGRGVITLDISLRADEVDLPYSMIVTAYEYKVIHQFAVRYNMTLEMAYKRINKNPKDPLVVDIIDEILSDEQWIFILREPTDNRASIVLSKIRRYKMNDDTISLPPEPLSGLNADFDGDALNLCFLPKELVPCFSSFHFSCLTNYITEEVTVNLMDWSDICLGYMSL